ncbi:sigma factor G inhibitor Gin [Peribacillus tepidiphilus]|uniref:sigma factor G inhibitor Gin n=1 Tax=Peribacillus tepidiphilus TaxID=2652445 RepID=UPI001291E70A|nr:sigma factor G inhibitor Gin [Peribacillus tepidiphilus]
MNSAANSVGEICIVCEQKKRFGIHLYTSFICEECEKEMIQTSTSDSRYKFFLDQLKKVTKPEIFS